MVVLAFLPSQASFVITRPRFVYVDPKGYVRVYGDAKARSAVRHAREPDLAPDHTAFVYWVDAQQMDNGALELREHSLRTGRERVLCKGNLRSPRYAADGKTLLFVQFIGSRWSLLALDLASGKARIVGVPTASTDFGIAYSSPEPLPDGTLTVSHGYRILHLDLGGRLLDNTVIPLPASADRAEPHYLAPAPGKPNRILLSNLTNDADERIVGTDGLASALWIYDARTLKAHRITGRTVYAQTPCWTPDGGTILFQGGPLRGKGGIWSVRPDGAGLRFLARGEEPSAGL